MVSKFPASETTVKRYFQDGEEVTIAEIDHRRPWYSVSPDGEANRIYCPYIPEIFVPPSVDSLSGEENGVATAAGPDAP